MRELKALLIDIRHPEIQLSIWKNRKQAELESDTYVPPQLQWIYFHSDEVMYFHLTKNRNWSNSYENNPEKYKASVDEWFR